jgi:hypothetical protein
MSVLSYPSMWQAQDSTHLAHDTAPQGDEFQLELLMLLCNTTNFFFFRELNLNEERRYKVVQI